MTAGISKKRTTVFTTMRSAMRSPVKPLHLHNGHRADDSKAKNELECVNNSEDNIVKLIPTTSLSIVKRNTTAARLLRLFCGCAVKSVSASEYVDDDGYNVSGYIEVDGDEIDVDFDIAYPEKTHTRRISPTS
jgi:hypothetical protein